MRSLFDVTYVPGAGEDNFGNALDMAWLCHDKIIASLFLAELAQSLARGSVTDCPDNQLIHDRVQERYLHYKRRIIEYGFPDPDVMRTKIVRKY